MLRWFARKRAAPLSKAMRDEIDAICHALQIEALAVPGHLRKDVGLDCGCDQARSR